MTRWATLAIGFLAFCSFPVTGPAQAQSGSGWITLFDGKNLDHWQGDGNANFAIDDGSIVAKDKKDAKTTAFLISKEKYKDFQIYAEFWVSNDANSGIFIRCEDPKKPGAKTCYECNIFDTRPDPSYGTGAIVYHAEVNPMPKAGGKWSTMEITAKGRDLSILFDGKQTASVRSGAHTEGPVALQYREGEDQHRHQPTHGTREKCCVDLRKRKFRELLAALDHPVPGDVGDEHRHNDNAQPVRDHVSED